jgi:hypothetical protein
MERFLEHALAVLQLLDFDLFRSTGTGADVQSLSDDAGTLFEMASAGARAVARETDDGFIVLAGGTALKEERPALQKTYQLLRNQLRQDRKLTEGHDPALLQFVQDVRFSSPSAAASVIAARSASGPEEWTVRGSGQTYKTWQAARLSDR